MSKRIAIMACKPIEQNICPADVRCPVTLMRRKGEFERYKYEDVGWGRHGEGTPSSIFP